MSVLLLVPSLLFNQLLDLSQLTFHAFLDVFNCGLPVFEDHVSFLSLEMDRLDIDKVRFIDTELKRQKEHKIDKEDENFIDEELMLLNLLYLRV